MRTLPVIFVVIFAILIPLNGVEARFLQNPLEEALRQRILDEGVAKRTEQDDAYIQHLRNNPQALREYIQNMNEYFAIIGRPRLVFILLFVS